jgi:Galactose oxidase, central domain
MRLNAALSILGTLGLSACGGGGSSMPSPTYSIGGKVAGLTAGGLVLANGTDTLSVAANASTFTFSMPLASGTAYSVVIKSQPTGLSCQISAGSGTVATANLTTISVTCPSPWVWRAGSNAPNAPNVYGTEGVATAGNVPGARQGAATWTDGAGNFWLFGGVNVSAAAIENGNEPTYNDLWRFNPGTGLWTWVSGGDTPNQPGVYGTEGSPAASNVPGARAYAVSWTDAAGNLWLFGGLYEAAFYNDLWTFNPDSGLWTWVSGSNVANASSVYGTQGVAAAGDVPGARAGANAWIDAQDNLWVFGGQSPNLNPAAAYPYFWQNDLWKFTPSTGLWTWISGSGSDTGGTYGTKGTAAPGNVPGARSFAAAWTDGIGNFWLFGGIYPALQNGDGVQLYADLWKFTPGSGLWTWESGSDVINATGVYGTEGTAASSNMPGARSRAISWLDASGNLLLFGGLGLGQNPDLAPGAYDDLWSYSPSSGQWTWINGADTGSATTVSPVYGTLDTTAVGNTPGSRDSSAAWIDLSGNLWLFGGELVSASETKAISLNDLWVFNRP